MSGPKLWLKMEGLVERGGRGLGGGKMGKGWGIVGESRGDRDWEEEGRKGKEGWVMLHSIQC